MDSINITISSKDKELLQRMAVSGNRRFQDLAQLLFAEGVKMFYCDEGIYVEKLEEEYTAEDHKQFELNAKIEKEGGTWEERTDKGYKYVSTHLSIERQQDSRGRYFDSLVGPLAKRIAAFATK